MWKTNITLSFFSNLTSKTTIADSLYFFMPLQKKLSWPYIKSSGFWISSWSSIVHQVAQKKSTNARRLNLLLSPFSFSHAKMIDCNQICRGRTYIRNNNCPQAMSVLCRRLVVTLLCTIFMADGDKNKRCFGWKLSRLLRTRVTLIYQLSALWISSDRSFMT